MKFGEEERAAVGKKITRLAEATSAPPFLSTSSEDTTLVENLSLLTSRGLVLRCTTLDEVKHVGKGIPPRHRCGLIQYSQYSPE